MTAETPVSDVHDATGEPPSRRRREDRLEHVQQAIEHAAHYLPAQGPINVFIHHNTLHAFEDLPFNAGVQAGAKLFGCQPYLSEDRYREMVASGRIRVSDLVMSLLDDLGEEADKLIGFMGTRFQFRLAMLQYPPRTAPPAELRWFVAETNALTRMRAEVLSEVREQFLRDIRHWVLRDVLIADVDGRRATPPAYLNGLINPTDPTSVERWRETAWEAFSLQALWRVCREGVHSVKPPKMPAEPDRRLRDLLLEATGQDTDHLVHDLLIPFCAAFLDQGFSRWTLPDREQGFFRAFLTAYGGDSSPPEPWLESLPTELARWEQSQIKPCEALVESLELLGVPESEWENRITAALLALRGWAGMIRQVELRADSVAHPIPLGSLAEFAAIRMLLDRLAIAHVCKESLDYEGELSDIRRACRLPAHKQEGASLDQRAFAIFELAQVMGWLPGQLAKLKKEQWSELVGEMEAFPLIQRRRIFHAAFERRYRTQTLDAISIHAGQARQDAPAPRFQLFCCLDEREESFRRHIEEIAPDAVTFGAAGFYGLPMYYRGAADAHFVPLCPIVIRPQHWVREAVAPIADERHTSRAKTRRALGMASHRVHLLSRTFVAGAVLAAGAGALASLPLVARVLFPRTTARLRSKLGRFLQPPTETRLEIERRDAEPSPQPGHLGYTVAEMAIMAERFLRDVGLTEVFAPLVVVLGHGSNSLNNPHNSAYNCGACGGSCGGPNARALAHILNDRRIRETIAAHGIVIPESTHFVGGWHNTCNDVVTTYDLDAIPPSHQAPFERVRREIEQACQRNAHERSRRFVSAPLTMSFAAAHRHVEARSEDLAQTRPECGHASNALCIVARRSRTQGLFLDRRAFLTSYDPTQDDAQASTLMRLLQAAVPVCAGINLEYYFSYVDPVGYGCGTKLPHNVASLLGVMDGAASDLRPGLPWQMVEIHEPVRLLFIIETTPEVMNGIMDKNPAIGRLCRNGWVQVATLSPDSAQIHLLKGDRFEPYKPEASELPQALESVNWYRGWRENLGFAQIGQPFSIAEREIAKGRA